MPAFLTPSPIFLTLVILVLALIGFVTEVLAADFIAIIVAVALMVTGVVSPEQGISGFGNSATITVMAMFILSAGITRTGVVQVVRDWLVKWGGKTSRQQILVMGAIVGPISAFINNTAVVAVFLPLVEEWCHKQRISVSKLMMPLSFVTILGGMITVIGTSTNILASGLSQQLGYGEFSLFLLAPVGIWTFIIGLGFLAFTAPLLLPNRKPAGDRTSEDYALNDYVTEVVVSPRSSLIGQTLRQSELQRKFDFDVLEIIRNDTRFAQPLADKVLAAGDILLVRGSREDLLKVKDERGLEILADAKFGNVEAELSSGEEQIGEVLILSNSRLVGSTLKDIRFRQRYNATVIAIRRGQELVRERLGKVRLRFGDLLLVQGPQESFIGLQTTRELLVLEQRERPTLRQDKAWIAVAIAVGVILVAALDWLPILITALAGVVLMVITGCLKPGEIYSAVRWDVIFLLAGLIPLGIAMESSGTTEWVVNQVLSVGGQLPSYVLLLFIYVFTSLLTEIISNNAAVVLLVPLAAELAERADLNPLAFILAVTFAASNSFMTPIGYQTNTMVYGPGGYRFWDFLRVGGPMNLLMAIVTPLLITWIYGLQAR